MPKQYSNLVIIGLGISGISTLEYCLSENIPCQIIDTREMPPNFNEIKAKFQNTPIHTGGFHPEILKQADVVVLSPGIAKDDPKLLASLLPNTEVIGDIELFARAAIAPIAAITGSNGKSTVTTLLGEMARAAGVKVGVGGNLGKPALSLLNDIELCKTHDRDGQGGHRGQPSRLYVLELSSFQLETTYSLKPRVATVLNISPDHMDRYATLEDYLSAKLRIFNQAEIIVVNRDDQCVLQKVPKHIPQISFGLSAPLTGKSGKSETTKASMDLAEEKSYGVSDGMLVRGSEKLISIDALKMFGRHNVANALAALALGEAVGLPMESMLAALREFKGLAHRAELVRTLDEVQWINDSKGTNVGASIAAIEGLSSEIQGKWILIAGGVAKNADFSDLIKVIPNYCRSVVLIGEAAKELQALLKDAKYLNCVPATTMQDAVLKARALAKPGDGVLLSPACASFDMFKNFEDRGNRFKEAVQGLS